MIVIWMSPNFRNNLNKFQQENLRIIEIDEKFKFGPSGPYRSIEKLRFPIRNRVKVFWADVAIVDANIPMLLGNNILKPLEAEIKLLSSGNGTIKLKETEIPLRETAGGHFTLKVADIGKLCEKEKAISNNFHSENEELYTCDDCGKTLSSNVKLKNHKETEHSQFQCNYCNNIFFDKDCFYYHMNNKPCFKERKVNKPILKNCKVSQEALDNDYNVTNVLAELITHFNGSSSKREKKLIQTMKNLTQLTLEKNRSPCNVCDKKITEATNSRNHKEVIHEEEIVHNDFDAIFLSHH